MLGPSSNSSAGSSGTSAIFPMMKSEEFFIRVPIKKEISESQEEFDDNVNTEEIANYEEQFIDNIVKNEQVHVSNSEDVSVDDNVESDVTSDSEEEEEEDSDDSDMEIREPESESEGSDDDVAKIENQGDGKLYCSICKMEKYDNHDCFEENQQFSTCLIPNCNILFRSNKSFMVHFRKHLGVGPGTKICTVCFKEEFQFANVAHVHSDTAYLFKCYTCNIILGNMKLFVEHKFKIHRCALQTYFGNYLCFHCEKWSPDRILVTNHIKNCRTDQIKNLKRKIVVKPKVIKKYKKNLSVNKDKGLFACLKPTCKQIFRSFSSFKIHYRKHFRVRNQLFCWNCCTMHPNKALPIHKAKGDSHSNVAFKCIECSTTFDDIETFSVHKYTIHDGCLNSRSTKFRCMLCKKMTTIIRFKSHLIRCQLKKLKKIKANINEKCNVCGKCCRKAQGMSNHLKSHE